MPKIADQSQEPELRMGSNGRFTPSSLQDVYRWRISHLDGMDRRAYAYGVLHALCTAPAGSRWTTAQTRAIAEGLELGMNEGVR